MSKAVDKATCDDADNRIIVNKELVFLLPRVNVEYYLKHGLFEKHLIEWSKQLCDKSKAFVDIGAHTGTYTVCLAPHSKNVYSFEPQRGTYYALCGSVALSGADNVECVNVALGSPEQVGRTTLNIVSLDGGGTSMHAVGGQTVLRTEDAEVRTLDSMGIVDIGLIKMDAEYNELHILKGAHETLRNSGYPKILFESNDGCTELFDYLKTMYKDIRKITGMSNMFLAEN